MDLRPAPLSPSNTSIDSLSWSDPQAHRPVLGLVSMMLIFLVTVPTLLSLVEKARSAVRTNGYEAVSKLYEDEDGTATEDTQKGYSVALQKFLIFLGSLLGLAASITIAVLATPRNPYVEDWLTFGSWV